MKIAVVTGASSGIGKEFVLRISNFYQSLDEIWVIARRRERLEKLASKSPIPLRIFAGDLTKKEGYREFYHALKEEQPDIRILVNAAGFGKSGTVEEIASENRSLQNEMIELNCAALTRMTQMCLPHMRGGARIIQLASAAAFCPQPTFAVYAATKAYVLSFSRALGEELRPRGIYVTAVCPGPVDTEFFDICGDLKGNIKELFLTDVRSVVVRALKDSRKKRAVSVYGCAMKAARIGAKAVPHRLILAGGRMLS